MWTWTLVGFLISQSFGALAQTWCNKNYKSGAVVAPPGGQFPAIATSSQPLLAFRCAPAIKPYLAEDKTASIIIDTPLVTTHVNGAAALFVPHTTSISVTVSLNGKTLTSGAVPVNVTGHELPFSLTGLSPQHQAFSISCSAQTPDGQTFSAINEFRYMPNPTSGSVTKMDLRTGALLVNSTGQWEPVFPIGFYTDFGGYLAKNISIVDDLKSRGFTIIHPVPLFDNMTAFEQVLDRMEQVGMLLMYDMRYTYMNSTSVTQQVNMIKSRKNLLLWYTGDEPDGTSDPLNATTVTYDLINSLDGYHPVSLVLNCQDYEFTAYTRGADVVMQDAYPVGINATYSTVWHTPCTLDFGDCGCDNCIGKFSDISTRMDQFKQRLNVLGDTRNKALWSVPQAFGPESYWPRPPTGAEWLVQSVLAINHGALGIVPWQDPNPADIKGNATLLAKSLPSIKSFLFSPTVTFQGVATGGVDVGLWTVGAQTLLLATNTNYAAATVSVPASGSKATNVLAGTNGGNVVSAGGVAKISLPALGSVGYVLS